MSLFLPYGISSERIWALAGIDPSIFKPKGEITVTVDSGLIAQGIEASEYSNPTNAALVRRVGPGLHVIAELETKKGKTVHAYVIGSEPSGITLIPQEGPKPRRTLSYIPGENWYEGKAGTGGSLNTCRILLVTRQMATEYNKDQL